MKEVYGTLVYLVKKAKFSISIFIIMLLFSFVGYQIMKINLLKNAQNLGDNLSRIYALEQRGNLEFYSVLLSFGVSMVDNTTERAEITEKIMYFFHQVQNLLGEGIVDPYLVMDDYIVALNPWEGDDSYDFKNAVWFRQAVENPGKVIFTDTYTDAVYNKSVITIAGKCSSGAVLAFDIFPENFRFSNIMLESAQGSSFFLCDNQGTLLYAQTSAEDPYDRLLPYVKDLFRRIKNHELKEYSASIVDLKGERRGVYYYEMPNGWTSILTIPFNVILKDLESFRSLFYVLVFLLLIGMALLTWRNVASQSRFERTNEAVQVLGNSYYAVYRIDYELERYEIIKEAAFVRSNLAPSGPYEELLRAVCEHMEKDYLKEYRDTFSIANIRDLVRQNMRDFGGDFRQCFEDICRWVNIRVLFDEAINSKEVILCFREIEKEKQKQLEEHTLLVNSLNKAVQSDKAKQVFFSNMSHEMRTPLNAVINLASLAKSSVQSPLQVTHYLEKIEHSGRLLIELVNDILEISKLTQGKIELNNRRMDIRACLEECLSPFSIQAESEGKSFRVSWELSHTLIMGDAFRITQIMNNLLSNALKFTDRGDSIGVEVSEVSRNEYAQYKIVVSDTGIGMSEEYQSKIFEPYSRENRTFSRPVSGTGLGMPIVKSIVELLNGSIVVSSRVGQGTMFTVILPFLIVREEEAAPAPAEEKEAASGGFLSGKRILLAEDNEINMEVAEEILAMNGMLVEKAWNGREALEAFRDSEPFHFDAVLMDMQMPEMNGCEAGSAIRALPRPDAASVPIIAVTANAFAEDVAETARAGMNAHVSKPINFAALGKLLEKLIAEYRARRPKTEDCGKMRTDA